MELGEVWGSKDATDTTEKVVIDVDKAYAHLLKKIHQDWGRGNGTRNIARFREISNSDVNKLLAKYPPAVTEFDEEWIIEKATAMGYRP